MYKLVYDPVTGKAIVAKVVGTANVCIYEGSTDYQEFLIWNSQQSVPLDINSTIPIPLLTADQLPKSIVSAVVKSIANDKLSCMVTRTFQGKNYDIKAILTKSTADKLGKQPGINVGDTVMVTYLDHAPIGTLPIIVDAISAIVYPRNIKGDYADGK